MLRRASAASRARHLANRPSTARAWRVAEALEYGIVGINAGAAVSAETLDHLRSKLAALIGL
jgi:acyl-CoA reductase-like NAD-dependent aldehyde dehydrogenase